MVIQNLKYVGLGRLMLIERRDKSQHHKRVSSVKIIAVSVAAHFMCIIWLKGKRLKLWIALYLSRNDTPFEFVKKFSLEILSDFSKFTRNKTPGYSL